MAEIISQIRKELKKNVDLAHREGERRFFKGDFKNYGVRAAVVKKIAGRFFVQIKHLPKKQVFSLCETLLKSNYNEEAMIAFNWSFRFKKQYQKTDFRTFENWLKNYIDNWAKCDVFCTHSFGVLLIQFPEFLPCIKRVWAKSKNRWLRRASAVILIPVIKSEGRAFGASEISEGRAFGDFGDLEDVFEMADILLMDKDDLVQKGYGWLLKEVANIYQREVFEYVMKRKEKMPRTALRYAIEKMPQTMRKQAMAK